MTPAENKALRESMGLTLKWLAERWGVTVQSVKRWEGSRTPPPQIAKDMLDLKRKFDAEVQRLVEGGGDIVEVPPARPGLHRLRTVRRMGAGRGPACQGTARPHHGVPGCQRYGKTVIKQSTKKVKWFDSIDRNSRFTSWPRCGSNPMGKPCALRAPVCFPSGLNRGRSSRGVNDRGGQAGGHTGGHT